MLRGLRRTAANGGKPVGAIREDPLANSRHCVLVAEDDNGNNTSDEGALTWCTRRVPAISNRDQRLYDGVPLRLVRRLSLGSVVPLAMEGDGHTGGRVYIVDHRNWSAHRVCGRDPRVRVGYT